MSEYTEDTKAYPAEREAFMHIMDRIEYGATFEWDDVCAWMGLPVEAANLPREWEFNQPWLRLSKMLESEGFFSTERGMNGSGFRILTREEMAHHVKCRELRSANVSLSNSVVLGKVPRDGMSDSDIKKLDHWEEKSALIGATAKVLLRKRNLPSPEMVIRSVKQIDSKKRDEP